MILRTKETPRFGGVINRVCLILHVG